MRTTIDLPDDPHDLLSAVAHDQRRTLSQTASSLLRKALIAADVPSIDRDPRTGLPVFHVGRIVTSEDVRGLDGLVVTVLLDGNVLVALTVADHVHHDVVVSWFTSEARPFATTPTTQGTLLRFLLRAGADASDAVAVLGGVHRHESHEFWPDDAPYDLIMLQGVVVHRQVTDAYLAARARDHVARLATLDRGLAAAHCDVVELIDT